MSKDNGKYCAHLEAKIPSMAAGSLLPVNTMGKEPLTQVEWGVGTKTNLDRVVDRLIEIGLDPYQVELVVARVIENVPMKQIVKEQGWKSIDSANYHLKKALATLRERGFKVK